MRNKTVRNSADLAEFTKSIQNSLQKHITCKLSALKEALAVGWGAKKHAAQCSALANGQSFRGAELNVNDCVKRFSELCPEDPYLAELLRAELLGYTFSIDIAKIDDALQQYHRYSDVAYSIAIKASRACADSLTFIVPTSFGGSARNASIRIAAYRSVRVGGDFSVTHGQAGRSLISTKFIDEQWMGELYLHPLDSFLLRDLRPDVEKRCIRSAMAALARAAIASTGPWVRCVIYKPDRYEFGAWRVEMSLGPEAIKMAGTKDFSFPLPQRLQRRVAVDRGYFENIDQSKNIHDGRFVNGLWFGDLYTNGVTEENNQTSITSMYKSFVDGVNSVLYAQ